MNKLVIRLCALMVALTFVFSTQLQFHHHDRMGNIFITLSFIGEIELGVHNHSDGSCHHHHHHGTNPDDCGDEDDCSMHLDQSLSGVTDDSDGLSLPSVACIDIFEPLAYELDLLSIDFQYPVGFIDVADILYVSPDRISLLRRGPPCLA